MRSERHKRPTWEWQIDSESAADYYLCAKDPLRRAAALLFTGREAVTSVCVFNVTCDFDMCPTT